MRAFGTAQRSSIRAQRNELAFCNSRGTLLERAINMMRLTNWSESDRSRDETSSRFRAEQSSRGEGGRRTRAAALYLLTLSLFYVAFALVEAMSREHSCLKSARADFKFSIVTRVCTCLQHVNMRILGDARIRDREFATMRSSTVCRALLAVLGTGSRYSIF